MATSTDERVALMVRMYGECCTKAAAARVLGRNVRTISRMLDDGRIEYACAGTMVDVRSIVEYMYNTARIDEKVRVERVRRRYGTKYAV